MKYRKKPIVIEAFRFGEEPFPKWFKKVKIKYKGRIKKTWKCNDCNFCEIETLEGTMKVFEGDYIIRGIQGEIYPCDADIFEQTYEKVEK